MRLDGPEIVTARAVEAREREENAAREAVNDEIAAIERDEQEVLDAIHRSRALHQIELAAVRCEYAPTEEQRQAAREEWKTLVSGAIQAHARTVIERGASA